MTEPTAGRVDAPASTGRKRGPKPRPRVYQCPQVCSACGAEKPPEAFERDRTGRLRRQCRDCHGEAKAARMRERYASDPAYRELVSDRNRAYRESCRDYLKAYARRFYTENRERLIEDARQYRRRKAEERAANRASADSLG